MLLENATVLIAHEDESERGRINEQLRLAKCERILYAASGEAAVQHLIDGPFDLAVIAASFADVPPATLPSAIRSGRLCSPGLPIVIVYEEKNAGAATAQVQSFGALALPSDKLNGLGDTGGRALAGHQKPRVLIVEDDPSTARFLGESLADLYACDIAPTGDSGLAQWRTHRHDLVLLDFMLPGMSGEEVLKAIRQQDGTQLVIILTGHGSLDHYRTTLLRGAIAFIDKPVSIDKLRATCEKALRDFYSRTISNAFQGLQETIDEVTYHITNARDYLSQGLAQNAQFSIQGALGTLFKDRLSQDSDPMAPENRNIP